MKIFIVLAGLLMIAFDSFSLDMKSSAFENGGEISSVCTCDSDDTSPFLCWNDIPLNTESFAVICDDPDAPFGTWTHWIIFNISKDGTQLEANFPKVAVSEQGIMQGVNDFGKVGYNGPCPPQGTTHRYLFKLYALDTKLSLPEGAAKKDIIEAMQGHIISETKIMGTYKR